MAVNVQPVLHCLITNESVPSEAILTAHLLSRSEVEDPKIQEFLKKSGAAAFNSRRNIISLRADWKTTWKSGKWIIAPVKADLLKIISELLRNKNRQVNAPIKAALSYHVTFIPLSLQGLTISRSDSFDMNPRSFRPPYNQFPILSCKAHPYFLIYKALSTLESFKEIDDADTPSVVLEIFALLHSIVTLWKELSDFPVAEDEPPAPTPSTSATKRPATTILSQTLPLKKPRK